MTGGFRSMVSTAYRKTKTMMIPKTNQYPCPHCGSYNMIDDWGGLYCVSCGVTWTRTNGNGHGLDIPSGYYELLSWVFGTGRLKASQGFHRKTFR